MPSLTELLISLLLVGLYLVSAVAIFAKLRSLRWRIMASIAVSIPINQAIYSVIFQLRFLAELPFIGVILSAAFITWSAREVWQRRAHLLQDGQRFVHEAKRCFWISLPLSLCCIYTLAQVLLLPNTNIDAQTYHFPRVWLFIQQNTLFLENFTRYHEVIFPVGADILFYPFLSLKVTTGLAIFSLSSYLAIGAGVYSVATQFTNRRNAGVCMLIMMSLTMIVLQAASVKNDILMANAGIAAYLIAIRFSEKTSYKKLLLLLCICAFGLSTKTTFALFLPGLAIIVICKTKLWRSKVYRRLIHEAFKHPKLQIALVIPLLISSQIWLYAWNIKHYEGWSGPESFTQRHTQNDGIKGFAANTIRYSIHSFEIGFLTNSVISQNLGIPSLSETTTQFYDTYLQPYFNEAGSERGAFYANSLTQEDYSWFGPLGACILFICLPTAGCLQRRAFIYLIPAVLYYLLIAGSISWMIWNGRFMTLLFITLTPALAIFLDRFSSKLLTATLTTIAILSLIVVKTTDFNRSVFAVGKMVSRGIPITPQKVFEYSFAEGNGTWVKVLNGNRPNPGNPNELLAKIPSGADVAIIGFGHLGHINFYWARPDINWLPLNGSRQYGEIDTVSALGKFIQSNLEYCVIVGPMPAGVPYHLALHCDDDYGHVITKRLDIDER